MRFEYTVRANEPAGPFDRFWAAAGHDSLFHLIFTPAGEALLSRMKDKGALRYLRCHYTLSEAACDGYDDCGGAVCRVDADGRIAYDFERINAVFRQYLRFGAKPVVEMDFLPLALSPRGVSGGVEEGFHSGRTWPRDWARWADLLRAFMRNLTKTFGTEEIRTWYFEVWNEPDSWPVAEWPMFWRMYDIFVDCVTGEDSLCRVGGPGTFTLPFLRAFLEHVANGKNAVTGRVGTRIDFISHHIYGMSGAWLDEWPLILPTVQRFSQQLLWIGRIVDAYPALRDVPLHLNEWGVCSNYERGAAAYPPLEVRNSEYSALFLVKLTDCIRALRGRFGLRVDMLLYWGFALEDDRGTAFAGNRDLMTAGHLPKPILSAYELLARMGETALPVSGSNPGTETGLLAASGPDGIQLLAYDFNELDPSAEGGGAAGAIRVEGLRPGLYAVSYTRLDRTHHNTYRLWQRGTDTAALEDAAALAPDETAALRADGCLTLRLELPAHGLCLIELRRSGA